MTTFANDKVGKRIIDALLAKKLAACIQVLPIQSYYRWQGQIENDSEKLVVIKTQSSLYFQVEAEICRLHDYETPEVIKLPIEQGHTAYLAWLSESCKSDT